MRYLGWIAKLLAFLVFFGFALRNTDPVRVRYFPGHEWYAPLSLVLLLFFAAGAVLGVTASVGLAHRQRRELAALKRSTEPRTRPLASAAGEPDDANAV